MSLTITMQKLRELRGDPFAPVMRDHFVIDLAEVTCCCCAGQFRSGGRFVGFVICDRCWHESSPEGHTPLRAELVTLTEAVQSVVRQHGGIRAAERATGVDKGFMSRLLRGLKTDPGADTLAKLGLRAVPLYELVGVPRGVTETGHHTKPPHTPMD